MRFCLVALLALAGCTPPSGTEAGALEDGDRTLASGEYFDAYRVRARAGQWLRVEVTADGFDPYLIIKGPGGPQSEVDDSELGNTTSTVGVIRVDKGGRWDVIVTSFAANATGTYRMTYTVSDERPADAPPDSDALITV